MHYKLHVAKNRRVSENLEQLMRAVVTGYEHIFTKMFSFLLLIVGLYLYKNIRSSWKKLS
jgi:hypothetical protein